MYLHTVVAHWAVRAARWSVEAACWAPLHAHLDAFDLHCLIEWSAEIILFVLIFLRCRHRHNLRLNSYHNHLITISLGLSKLFYRQWVFQQIVLFCMYFKSIAHASLGRDILLSRSLPLGKIPGSIKVAMQKLARVKRKITPLYIGMTEEKCSDNHGHLESVKEDGNKITVRQASTNPHT